MAITQNTFTGNGSNLGPFTFTFKWLESTDVKVTVNGVLKTAGTHYNLQALNYTTKDGGQVLFTAGNAPAANTVIRIYRDTDDSALPATFFSGSAIRSQDLNDDFTQNLYSTQEVKARYLDRQSGEMEAVYVPATSTSVVTKGYMETNYGIIDEVGFTRWRQTASAAQTTFTGAGSYGGVLSYVPTKEQVYLNGALQQRDADYAASNGTSIVFNVALTAGDVVDVVCVNNLTASTVSDAANITYGGQFTGQSTRTVAAKLGDVVSVKDFGAVGDGVADDTVAIQAALNSRGASGGIVILPSSMKCRVGSLTIPKSTALVGELAGRDVTPDNIYFDWTTPGSALLLNSGATITVGIGSRLSNCLIRKYGMTFPQTSSTGWTGTAVIMNGYGAVVSENIILGFNLGISAPVFGSRIRIEQNVLDCNNCIAVSAVFDTSKINDNKGWPYCTHEAYWLSGNSTATRDKSILERTGIGLSITNGGDDAQVNNNGFNDFLTGFYFSNAQGINLGTNWADHINPNTRVAETRGFWFDTGTEDIIFDKCYAYGVTYGVVFNGGTSGLQGGQSVRGNNIHAESCSNSGISINSGDVYIKAIEVESCPTAVSVGSSVVSGASQVQIETYQFKACTTAFSMPPGVTTDKFKVGSGYSDTTPLVLFANNPVSLPSLASADPLILPPNSDTFIITGTTGIGTLTGGWVGRKVVFIFTDSLTVFDGTTMNLNGNFSTTANDVLVLLFNGSTWLEVSRSSN